MTQPPVPASILLGLFSGRGSREPVGKMCDLPDFASSSTGFKFSLNFCLLLLERVFHVAHVKSMPTNAGDTRDLGSVPGLGRSPSEGHGNPLQYSCLEYSMDRGVHGVGKS